MSKPRVGFLGVGWIGRHRMEAMLATDAIDAAVICDLSPDMVREARKVAPEATVVSDLDAMLSHRLDGIVIATPSGGHAEQAIRCLDAGLSVFCQKPLGRDAQEVAKVVAAAQRADRLLMVDFSYRHTRAMQAIADLVRSDALGRVFAVDLVFHNAYGPDKPWFYDRSSSGGGCLMDLGSHLVDLVHWTLRTTTPANDVAATLLFDGSRFTQDGRAVEDYAIASFSLGDDIIVRLACSWRLNAGCDAVICATFYGSKGAATARNVNGSFYDFEALSFKGTSCQTLVEPPDDWGGRGAVRWAEQARCSLRFRPEAEEYLVVAHSLDHIYAGSRSKSPISEPRSSSPCGQPDQHHRGMDTV